LIGVFGEEAPNDDATQSEELLGLARGRLTRSFDVRLPYGLPMDWTVLLLHAFWDAWIHERDVLLALSAEDPTADDDATFYASAYGVFLAAVIASLFGRDLQEKLMLGSDGGGVFDLDSHDGMVTLSANRVTSVGPPAAQVTDALAGRSPVANALRDLPSHSRAALSHLADFMNTPVEQSPT
jgi:hypothetical protein